MFKKIIILLICSFIAFTPCLYNFNFSFAEDEEPSFITVDDEYAFTAAMKAYAQVNYNLTTTFSYGEYNDPINSFIAGWSYKAYKRICNTLGIDLTTLQQSIQYRVDSNGALQFLYSGSYIQNYNAVIRQYMLDNNIDPDAFNQNQRVYSGLTFKDNSDPVHSCLVFIMKDNTLTAWSEDANTHIDQYGTPYRYDGAEARRMILNGSNFDIQIPLTDYTYTMYFDNFTGTDYLGTRFHKRGTANNNNSIYLEARPDTHPDWNITTIAGYPSVFKLANGKYYFGNFLQYSFNDGSNTSIQTLYNCSTEINTNTNNNLLQTLIDIAKAGAPNITAQPDHSALIDVGKMGADNAVNALKKYIEDDNPEDEPQIDPDYKGGKPNFPTPSLPSIPIGFVNNMPINITLPNLDDLIPDAFNNIPHGFSIPGLRYKFPFCIPFDMIAVYEVLDTTPEAPHFQTQINFATFNYDLDIDLQDYDPYMIHIRNYFLILYIFGLLFITPKLLKA